MGGLTCTLAVGSAAAGTRRKAECPFPEGPASASLLGVCYCCRPSGSVCSALSLPERGHSRRPCRLCLLTSCEDGDPWTVGLWPRVFGTVRGRGRDSKSCRAGVCPPCPHLHRIVYLRVSTVPLRFRDVGVPGEGPGLSASLLLPLPLAPRRRRRGGAGQAFCEWAVWTQRTCNVTGR